MLNKLDPNGRIGFILTAVFSLFFVFYTLGWAFISGHASYWNVENNDITQHLSGLNLYLSSPWQFPLLGFDGLNYPQGTRVTFIDGIPIFAFLLKVFLPRDIGYINPMGYWVVLSFLLQGVSAWWITRELQIKSWAFLAFLVFVLLTFPAFIGRLVHVALMSHWIILFAIALYLRGKRLDHVPMLGWSALLFCSFYIHIYLFVMAFGIYIAAVLGAKHKLSVRYVSSLFLPLFILGVSLFIFLLPLSSEPVQFPSDFNKYGMNLLVPFYGGKLIKFHVDLSQQHEQGQYLGLGVIFIFLWIMISSRAADLYKTLKSQWALFLIISLFFLYSLSSKIYFSSALILTFEYPNFSDPITTQFRACGRFFWPVGYMIIIFSLKKLYHQCKSERIFLIIVMILLLIQCIDILDKYKSLKNHKMAHQNQSWIDYSVLDNALGGHIKYIYLYPKYSCKSNNPDYTFDVVTPMMKYAAMHQLKLNTGFVSRYGSNCHDMAIQIAQSDKMKSGYVFSKSDFQNMELVYQAFGDKNKMICKDLDVLYACRFKIKA